jgi:pimeloyl-ACP methyl ester carboxylesterase
MSLLAASVVSAQAPAPSVAGSWEGSIDAMGTRLRIGVAITRQPDGALTATMDSPDQGAYGLALSDVTFAGGVLRFVLKAANGSFEGTLNAAGSEIAGTWTQAGALPLTLKKVDKLSRPNRPQEPKPPFPYRSEDVTVANAAANVTLAGTLTLPEGPGPFPAVVLISGSGPQNRDEELLGHKPFLVLADHLTRRGIAVLRYDDRGIGKSTGDFGAATSEDFAGDALAAWQFLGARRDIDPRRIGLLGHSEGGLIAPMLAARTPGIAFVVMLAGPGVTGEQIMLKQGALIMKANGAPDTMIAANIELQKQVFTILREETEPARIVERLSAIPVPGPKEASAALVKQSSSPWLRHFALYDPAPALEKIACPVLAMGGELDLQVPVDQNLPVIEAALKKGGNKDYTVVRLPGLNHLFQTSKKGTPGEYAQIEETMSPVALDTIAAWIRKRTGLDR